MPEATEAQHEVKRRDAGDDGKHLHDTGKAQRSW